MNFFTNTSIIIFLMIFSKIEYSIAEENDSQLDDILDENVQDMAVDYNYRGLDTATNTIPHYSPPKFKVLKEVSIVEQPTMAEPEEVEKFRKLLEAWLWVVVSVVVFLALCLVICMTWLVSLLRLK